MQGLAFHRALESLWRGLDAANKYIVETAPFTLAKDSSQLPRVGAILHNCLEALRVAAQLAAPFMPETAERLREALGLDAKRFADLDLPWGTALTPGGRTGDPVNLFPRIETADGAKTAGRAAGAKAKPDRRS